VKQPSHQLVSGNEAKRTPQLCYLQHDEGVIDESGLLAEQTTASPKTATLDQLDTWAERILDAPTLLDVFDGH